MATSRQKHCPHRRRLICFSVLALLVFVLSTNRPERHPQVALLRGLRSCRCAGGPSEPVVSTSSTLGLGTLKDEYGSRWPSLSAALLRPKRYAVWVNPFAEPGAAAPLLKSCGLEPLPGFAGEAHLWAPTSEGSISEASSSGWLPKPPSCARTGLKLFYPLDLASAMPALTLLEALGASMPARPLSVLDACSAPGGKLLVLAGVLLGCLAKERPGSSESAPQRNLVAFERDAFRFNRLKQNLRLYLPPAALRLVTTIKGDASQTKQLQRYGPFDGALVDAPCSSERERLLKALRRQAPKGSERPVESSGVFSEGLPESSEAAAALSEPWDVQKAHANARLQAEILSSVLLNTSPAGSVVYATCALSGIENDAVVGKVCDSGELPFSLHCCAGESEVQRSLPSPTSGGPEIVEHTARGWQLLPDRGGWGPIYWSLLGFA
ncbi:unnamed protein product [Polarella glacialis]|uniref:SAM-dependent MTase RsmB/NOP-type domain-containing protein n=1 Tax=Polarella glacialis TaxID=89957 RepID=A0A813GAP5_POLGL|nr:unnamed protein product [Polarella glacialis]